MAPRPASAAAGQRAAAAVVAPKKGGVKQVERNGHLFNTEAPKVSSGAKDMDILHGDHGLPKQGNLKDFIWTLTGEPHAMRRKEMMAEIGPEINQLRGYAWQTKWIVFALLAAHIGLGIYLAPEAGTTLKFWVLVYVFGASFGQALFLAAHEISHNLAFKGYVPNKLLGLASNLPLVLPFFIAFRGYHMEHHKYQGTEDVDEDLPTELEARLLSSTLGKWFYMFNQTWFYALRPVVMKPQAVTAWHLLNAFTQIAFCSTMVYYFGWGILIYFLASAHFAGSIHPLAAHHIAEHYTFAGEAETASYYGWLNMFTWNVGYHDAHHDMPNVPWTNLPKLREVGAKWYDNLPYHKSWTAVLWAFLTDPEVTLYNRVRREHREINKKVE